MEERILKRKHVMMFLLLETMVEETLPKNMAVLSGNEGEGQVTKGIQCSTTTFQLDYMNLAGKQRSQPMPHLNPNKSSPEN